MSGEDAFVKEFHNFNETEEFIFFPENMRNMNMRKPNQNTPSILTSIANVYPRSGGSN